MYVCCVVYPFVQGTNLNAVDESELEIEVGDGSCTNIVIHNATLITCMPPQSGSGTVDIIVSSYILEMI